MQNSIVLCSLKTNAIENSIDADSLPGTDCLHLCANKISMRLRCDQSFFIWPAINLNDKWTHRIDERAQRESLNVTLSIWLFRWPCRYIECSHATITLIWVSFGIRAWFNGPQSQIADSYHLYMISTPQSVA